jgi:hypothetical protein
VALLVALAGCTDVEAREDERALANVLGKWRSVAFYSAEPLAWRGTYEFKPAGEVEIHGAWQDPLTGAALADDAVERFEVEGGRVKIGGAPAIVVRRRDGRLEIVRAAHARTLGAEMESKTVLERVDAR